MKLAAFITYLLDARNRSSGTTSRINVSRSIAPFLFIVHLLAFPVICLSQSVAAKKLEDIVYNYNNRFQYDSSKLAIEAFLAKQPITEEDKYYAFLYQSFTYKRVFNYAAAINSLDSAYTHGLLTNNPAFFANNIMCQKAYVFFDTNKYGAADSLMKRLAANNYQFIDEEGKSKLFMQEAYLMYLHKDYKKAEARYKVALSKMEIASACDRPMIYGKLIELYAAMKEIVKLYSAYEKAVVVADSCGIVKYKLYATELMAGTLANIGAYKEAVFYNKLKDSLESVYDYKSYQDTLDQLQLKRLSELKERQISVQQENLRTKNLQIGLLIVSLIAVFIVWMYYELQQRQKRILQDKKNSQRFTVQLLQKTEDDRKHIAGHLHDGINHELLTVKNMINDADKETLKQRIDLLIEDVRQISHHLHPVVFSKVRLAHSITQLVDRVQKMNNFMLSAEVDYNKGLPLESELQLYRILQEAVTNMIKHSNAVAGKITLTQQVDAVVIDIKDNGKGFNVEDKLNSDKAFGLHNIIERSRAAGGDATIRSDENGTYIQIKIPLQ